MFLQVLQELARPFWSICHDFWMLRLSLLTFIFHCCTTGPVQLYGWNIQIFCSAVSVSERASEDNSILVRWNERVVIIHSYADVIEMKRANVRNCAFVAPSY